MRIWQTIVVILAFNFSLLNVIGQKTTKNYIVVTGTVKLARLDNAGDSITFIKILPIGEVAKTQETTKDKSVKKKDKDKNRDEIVKGAVIRFRDERFQEFSTHTDSKGKYRIILPKGKYHIYSTVSDNCFMCAEYIPNQVFQLTTDTFKFDILLQFYGCG